MTAGSWVSGYPKLRLAPETVRSALEALGLGAVLDEGPSGMVRLQAIRPG